ncbi:MAG: DUF1836 domain-containing protein [Lachnospiraceae bacterium]|nr:DUF1836 domain-containing protein [Lachnospiraceae bacterium]
MTIDRNDLINSIMESLSRIEHIHLDEILNIDLYMDQVTTLMDTKLRATTRYPKEDKILTKTMINNYAKNDLLPPPVKKKYSKEHVLMLIFIYYFKGVLSINDIQTLLQPLAEKYFNSNKEVGLAEIYEEVFSLEPEEVEALKLDVTRRYEKAQQSFGDMEGDDAEFLRQFAFICMLSYDVYIKKLMIEKIIDEMRTNKPSGKQEKKEQKDS